jgi:hypothetical protein
MAYVQGPVSRLGENAATSADSNELFLKQFAGEVLATFEEANVMMPLHTVRSIQSGKSAQFPAIGTATAAYHTAGESVIETDSGDGSSSKYLTEFNHTEKVITINDLLLSSSFIANIDEAKNHYDVRGEYSRQMGFALANQADQTLINYALVGARETTNRFGDSDSTQADQYLGKTIDIATAATPTGDELLAGIVDAAQSMDEKDVPSNDRFCVLTPANYYKLVEENKDAINRDYGNDGNGSLASGMVMSVAGMRLFKSNHLPTADWTPDDGDMGSISGSQDFAGTAGSVPQALCFQRGGIGTVKLLDLAVETEYQVERQGTLLVAKYAMGHDILRHECLVALEAG